MKCIEINFDGEVYYPHLELADDEFNIDTSFVDEDEDDSLLKARKKLFSKRIV